MLLGLLWTVFRKFAMKPTAVVNDSISSNSTSPRGPAPNGSRVWKNTEESLLEWVKLSMTAAYLFVVVSEFNIFRHSGVAVKSLKNRFVLVGIFGNFSSVLLLAFLLLLLCANIGQMLSQFHGKQLLRCTKKKIFSN